MLADETGHEVWTPNSVTAVIKLKKTTYVCLHDFSLCISKWLNLSNKYIPILIQDVSESW